MTVALGGNLLIRIDRNSAAHPWNDLNIVADVEGSDVTVYLYAWNRDLYNKYAEQYDVAILLYVLDGAAVRQHYITIVKNENGKYQAYNHSLIGGVEYDTMTKLVDATNCSAVVSLTFIEDKE